jgi:hypothetical protein
VAPNRAKEYLAIPNDSRKISRVTVYGSENRDARDKLRGIKARLNADIDHHVNTFTVTPQCLAAIKNMQHMLPPELREMVYDILLQDSEVPIVSTDLNLNIDLQASEPEFRFPSTLLASFDYAHILLAESGDATSCREFQDTRSEFSNAWYRSTNFRFGDSKHIRTIATIDRWGTGHNVAALVRSVTLDLGICSLRPVETRDKIVAKETLVQQLQPLLELRYLARLKLSVRSTSFTSKDIAMGPAATEKWTKVDLVEYLAAIFPDLTTLMNAGCRVAIDIKKGEMFEVKKDEWTMQGWVDNIWNADST